MEQGKQHMISLENRQKMILSGVSDVTDFDDRVISMHTEMGSLIVRGEGLHIVKLSVTSGEAEIEGNVCSIAYTKLRNRNESFFSRILK